MEYKDYYKTLGVDRKADEAAIKAAYRRLARKYHPDVNKEAGAEDKFKDLQEAYAVLRDPEKRQAYDQLGANWKSGQNFRPPPGWSGSAGGSQAGDFSDFFRNLFGDAGFGGFDTGFSSGLGPDFGQTRRPSPQTARLPVSLEDAYRGATRTLTLDPGGRKLKVKIPAGVTDGQQIRLAGQADGADLYLRVEIQSHPHFRLDGRDVELDLPITPWEAALGAKVQVPTLGGAIETRIPSGARSGQKLRLRGRGMPGKPAGDQLLRLMIQNPPADSAECRAAFEQLAEAAPFDPRARLL